MYRKNRKKRFASAVCSAALLLGIVGLPCSAHAAEPVGLIPVGKTVGIAADVDGAVVVENDGVQETASSEKDSLHPGDVIIELGGKRITCAQDVKDVMQMQSGTPIPVRVLRGGSVRSFAVTPGEGDNGAYVLGVWLRDSVYGLGTVTFVDPASGACCVLGHPITDAETGAVVPLEGGRLMPARVTGIIRGKSGTPGQLQGLFAGTDALGTITSNSPCGMFGIMDSAFDGTAVSAVTETENISTGPAEIMTDAGGQVHRYSVEISRVYTGGDASGRELMITVTDPALLELTGGIVQGMSGSPILQNGALVGAVTHVLIHDPKRGYGITVGSILREQRSQMRSQASPAA